MYSEQIFGVPAHGKKQQVKIGIDEFDVEMELSGIIIDPHVWCGPGDLSGFEYYCQQLLHISLIDLHAVQLFLFFIFKYLLLLHNLPDMDGVNSTFGIG